MGWTLLTLHRGDEQHGQNGERPCNDKDIASVGRERTYGLDPTCTFFFIALLRILYYTKMVRINGSINIYNIRCKSRKLLLVDFLRISRVVDGTGFEPVASAMPTLRSYQTDLPARSLRDHRHSIKEKLLSLMFDFCALV